MSSVMGCGRGPPPAPDPAPCRGPHAGVQLLLSPRRLIVSPDCRPGFAHHRARPLRPHRVDAHRSPTSPDLAVRIALPP